MKKLLFLSLTLVAFAFSSCSKDAKINRRIDGDWKVVSIGSEVLPADIAYTFSFSKDKKTTGSGTLTLVEGGSTETVAFTYTVGSEKMTITLDGFAEIFTVKTYEKKKFELIDSDNDIWVLEEK